MPSKLILKFSALLALMSGLGGCAMLNSVSITPVPANRSHEVSAESQRWIIFGFNFDNDYVDTVSHDLSRKCPDGKISGILTKDEVYNYFLFFVLKHKLTATGYCEKRGSVALEQRQ